MTSFVVTRNNGTLTTILLFVLEQMPVKLHLLAQYYFHNHNSGTGVVRKSVHRKVSRRYIIRRDSIQFFLG